MLLRRSIWYVHRAILIHRSTFWLDAAFLCHEYFLNLRREIEFFWSRRLNVVSIIFYLERYGSLLGALLALIERFYHWNILSKVRSVHQSWTVNMYKFVSLEVKLHHNQPSRPLMFHSLYQSSCATIFRVKEVVDFITWMSFPGAWKNVCYQIN